MRWASDQAFPGNLKAESAPTVRESHLEILLGQPTRDEQPRSWLALLLPSLPAFASRWHLWQHFLAKVPWQTEARVSPVYRAMPVFPLPDYPATGVRWEVEWTSTFVPFRTRFTRVTEDFLVESASDNQLHSIAEGSQRIFPKNVPNPID